jgi:hypothetical protein
VTPQALLRLLKILPAALPQIDTFAAVLDGLHDDACLAGAWLWVREKSTAPTPAQIREHALEFQKYLTDGPADPIARVVWQGMEYSFTAYQLQGINESDQPELRQAVYEQTLSTVGEHLEKWRQKIREDWFEREMVLEALGAGDWSQFHRLGSGGEVKAVKGE